MERPGLDEPAQDLSRASPAAPADVPVRRRAPREFQDGRLLTVAFGAVLPALGVLAGLTVTDLGAALAPTWFDVAAAVWACGAVAILEARRLRRTPASSVDHAILGSALGVAGTYCAICLPLLPLFVFACFILLGFLALAPYWNFGTLLSCAPQVVRRTREAGLRRGRSLAVFAVALAIYPGSLAWRAIDARLVADTLVEVGLRERSPGGWSDPMLVGRIPPGWSRELDDRLIDGLDASTLLGATQVADPRPWLPAPWRGLEEPSGRTLGVDPAAARIARNAWFRGHGSPIWVWPSPSFRPETELVRIRDAELAFDGPAMLAQLDDPGASDAVRGPLADLELVRSEIRIDGRTAAGSMVTADWELVVANRAAVPRQTRLQFRLPPGAFVHDLRLVVAGEWRPAVFAADQQVIAAYRNVARPREVARATGRDPALLRQVGPDRYRLVVYPVPAGGHATVAIGVTLPVRSGGGRAALALPAWIDRDATWPDRARHRVLDATGEEVADFTAEAVRDPSRAAVAWPAARTVTGVAPAPRLAAGWPQSGHRAAVLVDAFHGHGRHVDAQLTAALPSDAIAAVIHDGAPLAVASVAALPEVAAGVGFRAPFDRFGATIDTLAAWCAADPVDVLWIHGASTLEPVSAERVDPLVAALRRSGSRIVALPASPALTPNTLVEGLVAAGVAVQPWSTGPDLAATVRDLALGTAWLHAAPEPAVDLTESYPADPSAAVARIRALLASDDPAAHRAADDLAVAHRIVTPRVGAVVLETDRDYVEQGLNPPGPPPRPAGSAIPEWSTWLLLITGAVAIAWCRRRRP